MFKKVYILYSAFCTHPAFYSRSAVCILHSVCILPLARSLRFTLTGLFYYDQKSVKGLCSASFRELLGFFKNYWRHDRFL